LHESIAESVLLTLDRKTQKNFLVLFVSGLFFWLSMTCLLPVLSAYIQDVGGTTQQVGLIMGCFAIGLLLSRAWLGELADRRGRKITLLIGTAVVAIAPIGYLLFPSIPILAFVRAFHGISIAAFTTGYSALVVDLSPFKQRGELIGYMSLAIPIGMTIGPALGSYLQESAGYPTLFIFSFSTGLLAFLGAIQVKESKKTKAIDAEIPEIELHPSRSTKELFLSPSLIVPGAIQLLIGLLFGTLATFLPLFVRATELNANTGLYYSVAAIASFIVRIYTGKASDRWGRGIFITASLICYGVSMILLGIANDAVIFILSAAIEGLGGGVLIPMLIALMSDRSYPSERGKVFSVCNSGFDLGVALAGPIFGALAEIIDYRTMFPISSGFAVLALLIFLTLSGKNLRRSLNFALGTGKDDYALES
jgi:MFS family permease